MNFMKTNWKYWVVMGLWFALAMLAIAFRS